VLAPRLIGLDVLIGPGEMKGSIFEGTITQWFKKEGDPVKENECCVE
jgi:hypothetical protein